MKMSEVLPSLLYNSVVEIILTLLFYLDKIGLWLSSLFLVNRINRRYILKKKRFFKPRKGKEIFYFMVFLIIYFVLIIIRK